MEIAEPVKRGFRHGLSITIDMVKVIVPFYVIIELIKHVGLIEIIGNFFKPVMGIVGLPGEAALALIAGFLTNLYAAIAVLTPLHLPAKDVTIVALILGISHSLMVETPITKKTGVNAWVLLLVRIFVGLFAGLLLNMIWKLFS